MLAAGSVFLPSGMAAGAQDLFCFDPNQNIIPAPDEASLWPEFRRHLDTWRDTSRRALGYSDELYRRQAFSWVTRNFCCCFLMLCDEHFYDARRGRYAVREYVEHGVREFGGYDSVVLWHAYPRIGLDDRNQFDFYRDMPGGLRGLKKVVAEFHGYGIKVFIDYNPWDTGTRREDKPDLDALCEMIGALDADGIFLDTMDKGAAEFRTKLDAVRAGVVLESEGALPVDRIHDHHASWAQEFPDSHAPGILRNKWFEPRHLQHQIRRWNYDHTGELHAAWMNGSGMLVWENVFGSWMGWNPRDRSILRSMLPIQRRYSRLFCGGKWTPLVPTAQSGLYASLWEADGLRLWTLVNRDERGLEGEFLPYKPIAKERMFDLVEGVETREAAGRIRPRGIACFLAAAQEDLGRDFSGFLRSQSELAARTNFNRLNPRAQVKQVTTPRRRLGKTVPAGMVAMGPVSLEIRIQMRSRECGFYDSNPPEQHRLWASYTFSVETFTRQVTLNRFAMDATPVTNAEFARFMSASKYRPRFSRNLLKHWRGGSPVPGTEEHPVVYVDLDDARAYARWAGKRLPTEVEWQYAAQGEDSRKYPWGNLMLPGHCNGGEYSGTTPVRMFSNGRSPFGLFDMCGNVWEWTAGERTDGRTRFCIVRGGSFYSARGSGWYMDGGPQPVDFAAKFLLMWGGLDRCATVGFRCAVDI